MKNNKETKKERGVTLIVLAIIVIILVLLLLFVIGRIGKKGEEKTNPVSTEGEVQEEEKQEYVRQKTGSKLNISEEVQKEKKVGNLKITNIQLKEKKGITTLLADIENTGDIEIQNKMLTIEILDKTGKVITILKAPIDNVKAGEKIILNTSVTGDVSNAYDFKVKE